MYVMATAGHVDHGKSTLVRALTGMEPDRWAEERRRGLTIDLGFAWTTLPSGRELALVDVPGHERFLQNMLSGLGPAPAVCFVVAADEGWSAQSSDHRDAVAALGISHGVVVLTRRDRAGADLSGVRGRVRAELAGTGLRNAPLVEVSAVTGAGLDELRTALDAVLADLPAPDSHARLRLWIDRSFTIKGAGTVVTGTLTADTLAQGQKLELQKHDGGTPVTVRALHSRNSAVASIGPASRVAVNLREGIAAQDISRGDVLLSPEEWLLAGVIDVRRATGVVLTDAPAEVLVHIGTASVPARLRPLGAEHARLSLERPLPIEVGDRLVLRSTGGRSVLAGVQVLDVDPPSLSRRGEGTTRARTLARMSPAGDAGVEVSRRGAMRVQQLRTMGIGVDRRPDGVVEVGEWWVEQSALASCARAVRGAVERLVADNPLAPGLARGEALDLIAGSGLPGASAEAVIEVVVERAGLVQRGGYLTGPGERGGLGEAEAGIRTVEERLAVSPFAAPEAYELDALGLGARELAAAERDGRLLRLGAGVVLGPKSAALAMRELARLQQPFTTSQARQALGTTRRVAIPLLEYLDARGWTRRLDGTLREVR